MVDLFPLTEEQKAFQTAIHEFAQKEVKPRALELDRLPEGEVDWELVKKACEIGLFTGYLPRKYGGTLGGINGILASEELCAADTGFGLLVGVTGLGLAPVALSRDRELMDRFFPPMVEAEKTGKPIMWSFAITEPDAGSDVEDDDGSRTAKLATTARREGDYYILNGTKIFISGGNLAKYTTVYAALDLKVGIDSWTCFIVSSDTPGFSIGKLEDKMGQRSCPAAELIFDNAKVPVENRVGEEGEGWKLNHATLAVSRITVGAMAVGTARGAYEMALDYATKRYQGGRNIIEHQMIQGMLADAIIGIEAGRLFCLHATTLRPPTLKYGSMAKIFCTDMAMKVTTDAVQVVGGLGYMRDFGTEKYMRDAKLCQVYEGTNQINRLAVMKEILKEIGYTA